MLNFLFISITFYVLLYIIYTYISKKKIKTCQNVIYKYRPQIRTFIEQQTNPVSPFGIYKNMFYKPSPWWESVGNSSKLKDNTIQPFSWEGLPKNENMNDNASTNFLNAYSG